MEKLLLATMLTFTFSLFADIGSPDTSNISKETTKAPLQSNVVFTLTQAFKNHNVDQDN